MESPSSPPPSSSRPPQRREGSFSVRVLGPLVIETTFAGWLTRDAVEGSLRAYWDMLGDRATPYAILDATGANGYEPSVAASAAPAMRRYKELGGLEYLLVSTNSMLRMMASALATTTRVPIRFFDTRADALSYLRSLGAW